MRLLKSSLLRACRGLAWRWDHLRGWWFGWLIRHGGAAHIALRWPWPLRKPWQYRRLAIVSKAGGLGDELMVVAVMRAIKKANPATHLTFVTRRPELFKGMSCLDLVTPFTSQSSKGASVLAYDFTLPPPRPLITLLGECVGLKHTPPVLERPRFHTISPRESLPRPYVVIQTSASTWTPNKQWPTASWERLTDLLLEDHEVLEVGTETVLSERSRSSGFHSYIGKTSLAELAGIIRDATLFIGPVSGGMHLAAAYEIPSVAICGGYESAAGYGYPNLIILDTELPCSPCWLTTGCPYDRKCLRAITPEDVMRAARSLRVEAETPQPVAAAVSGPFPNAR